MSGVARRLWRQLDHLSTGGWLLGLLFLALALTPSLIPRTFVVQGILCGCAFAAGLRRNAAAPGATSRTILL